MFTYHLVTSLQPGSNRMHEGNGKLYTNVVVYDAAGDVPGWHALSHSLHALCVSSRKVGLIRLFTTGLIRL